ncbi:MAG: hypothetical protein M3R17_12335 [Bacteroidota bacterium]|nr:hypothetical protein [Bacteroidota bacterium]
MRYLIICFAFALLSIDLSGQDFNYTVSKDSVAWQELNSQTIVNNTASTFQPSYRIPLGFTFNYLGRNFDSLTIEKSGLIVFDSERQFCFWGLIGYSDAVDSLGNHSVLGYELSGAPGNRELVIQFKNVATPDRPDKLVSYQVHFNENRSIEFIMGNYSPSAAPVIGESVLPDIPESIVIGLVNQNMDTPTRALTISETNPAQVAVLVDNNHPDLTYLTDLPSPGIRFVFNAAY